MYLVCGEALYDLFAEASDGGNLRFDATMGGSPLNLAVGIARLGGAAGFYGCISTDRLGRRLVDFLGGEGVSLAYVRRSERRTTLSLAQLDADGAPHYAFYGDDAADRDLVVADLPRDLRGVSGIHFGSYAAVAPPAADTLQRLARSAAEKFLAYDPNVRLGVEPDCAVWRARFAQYVEVVDYLKISMEDFESLFPGRRIDDAVMEWLAAPRLNLVVATGGGGEIRAWHRSGFEIAAPPASQGKVVDSVGAGDSFQAAMLTRFGERGQRERVREMSSDALADAVGFASRCAALTCARRGADLPWRHEVEV